MNLMRPVCNLLNDVEVSKVDAFLHFAAMQLLACTDFARRCVNDWKICRRWSSI